MPEQVSRLPEEGGPGTSALLGEWLASLEPGQASDLGWGLLGVLAAALGPLTLPQMADLLGAPVRSLHQAIAPVKDLLLAHGRFDVSDPMWPPRLAEYVGRAEREEGLARLTDWCSRWVQTGHRADDVPDYVIAHASTHLRDAGDAEALYGLIDKRWRRLSVARTGSPRAFMADMTHASEYAASASPPDRLQSIRATLALATEASVASRIPPEALSIIASAGQHHRAMDLAGFVSLWERSDAYGRIALALHRQGLVPGADAAADQAIAAAELYPGLHKLDKLAESFRDHGPEAWSLRAAARILATLSSESDPYFGDTAGKTAIGIFAKAGRLDEALQAAVAVTNEIYRDEVFTDVAVALAAAGRTRDAVSATRAMSENGRNHVLRALFAVIAEVAEIDGVLAAIDVVDDPEVKDQARLEAAIALARTGQADPALALAADVASEWRRNYTAKAIASALVAAGQVDRAAELAGSAASEERKSEALTNVAEAAAEAGLTGRALQVVALIPGEWEQSRATEAVAGVLARLGNVTEATDLADASDSQYDRDHMLTKVSEELAKAGHLHHAVEVAETVSDNGKRAGALLQAADGLTKAGHYFRSAAVAKQAATAARATRNISQQARVLTAWARALSLSARPELAATVAEQAISAAEAATDHALLANALAVWASALTQSGLADQASYAAERAIAAAQASERDWEKDRALGDVASTLARSGPADWAITAAEALGHDMALPNVACELARRGLADDALRAARALEHSWNRDPTLSDIADILARRGERTQALAAAAALLETSEEGHRSAASHNMERAIERGALALAENGHIDDALITAQAAGSPWETGQILIKVACAIGQAGDLDRATKIASEITPVSASVKAFGQLAETLANEGQAADAIRLADMALEVSQTSPSDPTEAEALAQLAVLLHAVGDIPAAMALAESAVSLVGPDPEAGGNAIVLAASAFAEAGDAARAISLAEQAAVAARTAVQAEVKAAILAATAPMLARAGNPDLAAKTARDALAVLRANPVIDFYRSDPIAATASSALAIVADVGEALAGLDLIHFSAAKTEALSRIAAELARRGQHGQLLALAHDRHILDRLSGADRVAALAGVAAALVTAGEPDQATALAEEARSDTEGLSEPGDRALALPHLALLLAHLGRTEEAATAAAEAQNLLAQIPGGQGGRAIMTTVQALVQAGQTNQALTLAQGARGMTQNQRAESLHAVAAALTSAEDEEQAAATLMDEAFAEVRISWHAETRKHFYYLLCELLPRHPDLLKAWLPGAGKISQLVQELAAVEGWWRDANRTPPSPHMGGGSRSAEPD